MPILVNVSDAFFVFTLSRSYPANISYMRTPKLHQSTALPYPFDCIISGAIYEKCQHLFQFETLQLTCLT
jgi:hypothetical protein